MCWTYVTSQIGVHMIKHWAELGVSSLAYAHPNLNHSHWLSARERNFDTFFFNEATQYSNPHTWMHTICGITYYLSYWDW